MSFEWRFPRTLTRLNRARLQNMAELPSRMFLQRRVSLWLDAVSGQDIEVEGAKLDLFDVLRGQFLLHGTTGLVSARIGDMLAGDERVRRSLVLMTDGDFLTAKVLRAHSIPAMTFRSGAQLRASAVRAGYILRRELQALGRKAPPGERDAKALPEKPVLVLPREPGHLADLLPVADELERRFGIPSLFCLTTRKLAERVASAGHAAIHSANWPPAKNRALAWMRAARSALARAEALSGSGHADLSRAELLALRDVAGRMFREHSLEVGRTTDTVAKILRSVQPTALLVGNPYTYEGRVATALARAAAIPSIAIQHGAVFPDDPRWRHCRVNALCAWGTASAAALTSSGFTAPQVHVTGAPRLDEAIRGWRDSSREHDAYILVATSGAGDVVSQDEHEHFIETLFAASDGGPFALVIKLHPKDHAKFYLPSQQRWPGVRARILPADPERHGLDIYDYLQKARALLTISSSTALDAMVIGVPVIAFGPAALEPTLGRVPHLCPPLCARVNDRAGLRAALLSAWQEQRDPDRVRAAKAHAERHFAHPGAAAHRTAQLIAQLASRPVTTGHSEHVQVVSVS